MSEDLDKALGEFNEYKSPQVPKPALPEEISKTPAPDVKKSSGATPVPSSELSGALEEFNRGSSKPEEKPVVGIPEEKSWLTGKGHPLELGLGGKVQQSIQGLIQEVQNVPEFIGKKLGVPEFRGPLDVLKEQFEPSAEQKAGMEELGKTIPGQIAGAAIQAPAGVIPYMVAGGALKLAKVPAALEGIVKFMGIGGKVGQHLPGLLENFIQFGGVGAASRLAEGGDKQAKGLLMDAAMATVFHYLGPLTKVIAPGEKGLEKGGFEVLKEGKKLLISAPVMGAMFGGQALVETGDMKQAIAPAAVGVMLSIFSGGKGAEKGVYEKEGKGYKKLLPESERKAISDKAADEGWEKEKEQYISDQISREEKEKATETGKQFATRMREAEASWKESELNKKREIAPGVEEGEPGVTISHEHEITELFNRLGQEIRGDELGEHINIDELNKLLIENSEPDVSRQAIARMEFDPQEGEMSVFNKDTGYSTVYGKEEGHPGLWAKRIMKGGVATKIDPHDATAQQVQDVYGWREPGEYTDVKKTNIIPVDTETRIETKVPVKTDILKPAEGTRGGGVELRHYTGEDIEGELKPDANGLIWFTEGESYLKGEQKQKGKWGYTSKSIPESKILRIDEKPELLKEYMASPFGKDGRSKLQEMLFAESKGYDAIKRGEDVAMRPKPAGEPAGTLLPPPSALAGEGFKPNQDVVYQGKSYIVNEIDSKTGKVSIYEKGKGGSIKEVDPKDLKAPETKGRAAKASTDEGERKYGLSKEQADTLISPEYWDDLKNNIERMGGSGTIVGTPWEIPVSAEERPALERAHGEPVTRLAGRMLATDMGNLIEVARGVVYEKGMQEGRVTASHEVVHLLEELRKITPEEIDAVDRYYGNVPRGGMDKAEHRAEQLGKAIADGGFKKGEVVPQTVRTVFNKIQDFLRKIVNYYEGLGYNLSDKQVVNNLIKDIANGEVAKRAMSDAGGDVTKFRGEIERRKENIQNLISDIKNFRTDNISNATQKAYDLGKTITRDQALAIWKERENMKNIPPSEDLNARGRIGYEQQMLRETVAGHLGEGERKDNLAFTETEIEDKLRGTRGRNIPKDVKEEIDDHFKKAHVGIKGVMDSLKKTFAPGARGPDAQKTVIGFSKELSKSELKYEQLETAMQEAAKGFDKMDKGDVFRVLQNMSTGEKQATPGLDKIEATLQGAMTDVARAVNDKASRMGYSDESLIKVRENYIPGVDAESWRAKQGMTQSGPLPTSRILEPSGIFKSKIFQDFNSRIEAGYEPTDWNPVRMFLAKYKEEVKLLHNYTEIDTLMKDGLAVIIKPGETPQEGWMAVPEPYGTTKLGKLVMTENAGQVFKNYLSRPLASNETLGGIYRGYMNLSTALQRFQLFGLFHFGFEASEAIHSRGALAFKQLYGVLRGTTDPITFLKTASSVPFAPVIKYRTGLKVAEERLHPGTSKDPRIIQAAEDVTRAGGGISQERMFTDYWVKEMQKDYRNGKYIGAATKSPMALMEVFMKPLMQDYVPHLKLGAFEELSSELRRVKPGLSDAQFDQEMHEIWNRIDSRLGQVRWQRIFMNNSAKNFLQAVIRAPGWTGGTILEIGGGLTKDPYNFFKEWHDTGKLPTALPDRAAYVMSLAVGTMVLNAAMSALFANKDPSKLTKEDYMAFDTGEKDERGNILRGMLPMYSKDVYAYAKAPGSTLWHKTNPIIGLVYELSKNKDYYGTGITDPTTGLGTKIGDVGKYFAKAFIPFGVRGALKIHESGASLVKSGLPPIVGIMPAPAYFSQSKAMQKAIELGGIKSPSGGRTKEEYDRNQLLNSYVKKYAAAQAHGEDVAPLMRDMGKDAQEGKLKKQDIMRFKEKLRGKPLEDIVTRLSIEQSMSVWRAATKEEKMKIVPIIFKKYRNLKDPNDKQKYAEEMSKISNDLSKIYNLGG